ncbi:lipid A deacylase LpxR family protein [Dyadobacter subterraneus]|uniref:Lipid A deacylase LpxR family protein n=1 Tax=Dyadobacter subterraneus TaxID=2773304 RepID=A0ABR9W929_9BACT|nr:lipid A deacylase LpxR family protein [Dyadobacter subterraneus]MBE9461993.1 lipid A deacylase LpxR family protein [Dyadobacter subterraneus]
MNKIAFYIAFSLLFVYTNQISAQPTTPTRLLSIYEDNDYLNLAGKGTDRAYTNGLRVEFFYETKKPFLLHLDDWLPKAGINSIDTYGWALMQMMFTPMDLSNPNYQAGDYPYSGMLLLTHSMISYNKTKRYNFRTQMLAGIRGPAALAEQSQILIHRLTGDQKPKGWQNQLDTKLLLNLSFTAEKQLANINTLAEIIAGASLSAGTVTNSVSVYPLIRLGKMARYFNGFFSQYSGGYATGRKLQFYLFTKPIISLVASNALMHGQIGRSPGTLWKDHPPFTAPGNHFTAELQYGFVFVIGKTSLSYTQKPTTAYSRGMYSHNTGNISLRISW